MEVFRNETFCLIGESGSGKTTLIRALLGFQGFHEGRTVHEGEKVLQSRDKAHQRLIEKSQLVFQDPVSSLDPVVQRRVSELLCRIKAEQDITFFMIMHDLGLVKTVGSRLAVMYLGGIVETVPGETFFFKPMHPYSRALLSSSLTPGLWTGKRIVLEGERPAALSPPKGCPFHPRCRMRLPVCEQERPPRRTVAEGQHVACHLNYPMFRFFLKRAATAVWVFPGASFFTYAAMMLASEDPAMEVALAVAAIVIALTISSSSSATYCPQASPLSSY